MKEGKIGLSILQMTIHKEGYKTIAVCAIIFAAINLASFYAISFTMPLSKLADIFYYPGTVAFYDIVFPGTRTHTFD